MTSLPATAGIEDFSEPDYDDRMTCYNSDVGAWVVIARDGDRIHIWVRNRPDSEIVSNIQESSGSKYFFVIDTIAGDQENLADFDDKKWRAKNRVSNRSYDCR